VIIVNQTSRPQSASASSAARTIRAASSGEGGSGLGFGALGLRVTSHGMAPIHSHRTAADSAPLMIECVSRIVAAAYGLHTCPAGRVAAWHRSRQRRNSP
jgi:hypothetical protein